MKIGIIGCGGIANGKHLPALSKMHDVELVAFCDLIPDRAQKAREAYGSPQARVYTDYRDLLADTSIDNVRVLTPNRAHSEITIAALLAGKDVLCEKPMAISNAQALAMLDAQRISGRTLSIGYQHRQDPDVQYVKRECEKGAFGDIYFAKARVLRRRGVPTWGVFQNEQEQGGGCLLDIGTHALDTVLWLMDNYEPAYCVGSIYHKLNDLPEDMQGNPFGPWRAESFEVEDSAFGYIVMRNGATIILETSWAMNMLEGQGVQYMLCGTKAGCDNFTGNTLRINGVQNGAQYVQEPSFTAGGVQFYNGETASPIVQEQRVFLDACRGKGVLTVLPQQAAVVTQILEAVYTSARTGAPVYFDR